jgi:hypothetical protein
MKRIAAFLGALLLALSFGAAGQMALTGAGKNPGAAAFGPTKNDTFQTTTGGTTVTFTSGSAYTASDIVFVLVYQRPASNNNFATNLTVGGGSGCSASHEDFNSISNRLQIWRCTAGSGTDVVFTFPSGTTNQVQANVLQFPAANIGTNDTNSGFSTGQQENSVTTMATPPATGTLAQANELILAILGDIGGAGGELDGPTGGYTQTMEEDSVTALASVAGWKIVAATTAVSANITATSSTSLRGLVQTVRYTP